MGLLSAVKAVALAADPSSLPVAELVHGRAASSRRKTWRSAQDFICTNLHMNNGKGRGNQARNTRSRLGGEVVSKALSGDLLQRGEGFAKLADGGGYLPCSQPVVGD
jgi:hypothetical protein